jgi:hypothetical protein
MMTTCKDSDLGAMKEGYLLRNLKLPSNAAMVTKNPCSPAREVRDRKVLARL